MEICEPSALPIPMVPRLHQSNGYIKRKLRAWRVQKCITIVGADIVFITAWPQSTPFHGWQYRAQNGNMRNFGPTNPHGTAFAPKQLLYEKEGTGMESPKMYCPSRCRYRTYHCVEAKYSVSWGAVQGTEWKYAKLRPYQSPWYRVCTKAMVISKGSYRHGEFKNVLPQLVQISYLSLRGRKVPRFMGGSIGPRMEICETSALPIPMVPRLHQSNGYIKRKLRAWRVRKCIALVGADTVLTTAWKQSTPFHGGQVVQGPEWKYAKLRPYQSPWYRVCTKAMVISKGSYGHGEFKNVLPQLVQISYLSMRGRKVPRFMGGSIGPRMEICETSALPIPMVPRLHQSNGYIKRKLRAWRVRKCIALVGADTVLTTAWKQSTPFHGVQYRAQNGNMRNFGPTNSHGIAFAPKQWLY